MVVGCAVGLGGANVCVDVGRVMAAANLPTVGTSVTRAADCTVVAIAGAVGEAVTRLNVHPTVRKINRNQTRIKPKPLYNRASEFTELLAIAFNLHREPIHAKPQKPTLSQQLLTRKTHL